MTPPRDHHATIFVASALAAPIEAIRRQWDPVMADQVAAHVTLVYPREAAELDLLDARLRAAARTHAPFRLGLGEVACFDRPNTAVYVQVHDLDGGFRALRADVPTAQDRRGVHGRGAHDHGVRRHAVDRGRPLSAGPVTRLLLTSHIRAPRVRCFDVARSVELHTGSAASRTLTSRITVYERPAWFRDSTVRGAFARLDHDDRFRDDGHGGTVMDDVFEFTAPYGPLGLLVERLLLAGYFRHLKAVAESEAWRTLPGLTPR